MAASEHLSTWQLAEVTLHHHLPPLLRCILSLSCIWVLFQCQQWSHSIVIYSLQLNRALGLHSKHSYSSPGYELMRESAVSRPDLFDASHHRGALRKCRCHVTLHASRTQLTPDALGYCRPKLVLGLILGSRTWHCWSLSLGPEYVCSFSLPVARSSILCLLLYRNVLSPWIVCSYSIDELLI